MTKVIFRHFLRRFDSAMKARSRKVLLLLDNFSGHQVDYSPTNVELLFLPPNTTCHLQPLDGGIICAFKAHFKRRQLDKAYRYTYRHDGHWSSGQGWVCKRHIQGRSAAGDEMDKNAWHSITQETIQRCWTATIYNAIDKHKADGMVVGHIVTFTAVY